MSTTRRGFTLPEMLLVLAVIVAAGAFAMPRLYDARRAENEAQAQVVLRMIASSQRTLRHALGDFVEFHRVRFAPTEDASELEPLMPFLPTSADFALYGGYRFQEMRAANGSPIGTRADPITPPYSGRRSFAVDYASGEVRELAPPNSATALP